MRPVTEGTVSLAVTRKLNSNGYGKVIKRDVRKLSSLLRPNSTHCVVFSIFPEFFNFIFLVKMASGRSRVIFDTSDSGEEVFAGFSMEEIVQIREEHQRRRQQQNLSSPDQNFDDSSIRSRTEAAPANQAQVPQNAVHNGRQRCKKLMLQIFHFTMVQLKTLEKVLHQRITFTNSSMTLTLRKLFATP